MSHGLRHVTRVTVRYVQPSRSLSVRLHSSQTPETPQQSSWTSPWAASQGSEETDSHLNPPAESYAATPFADKCTFTVQAGSGGHGCISFLRDKVVANGPPNGGDGGTGGNIWIQAVRSETSLHKLARRTLLRAGNGKSGRGKGRGGERGVDVLIQVPVGTTVTEVSRRDPFEEEMLLRKRMKGFGYDSKEPPADPDEDQSLKWRREKWLLYPGSLPRSFTATDFPALPRPRKSNLSAAAPKGPMRFDLDKPMDAPMLLAPGAMGGLGNPHFVTKTIPRPKYATRGDEGMSIQLFLELKLLADVGLVGLPNAGKSTLLRSLTRSRTRVGNWAFTTLQPNIGTVILDDFRNRPTIPTRAGIERRESFTIADIPGLVEDAHMDKGLGLGFLRHVERAAVLAFVVDLSEEDPVGRLISLWKEIGQYETLRARELAAETERRLNNETAPTNYVQQGFLVTDGEEPLDVGDTLSRSGTAGGAIQSWSISAKPWIVIGSKADKPETQEKFQQLQAYLAGIEAKEIPHPSGQSNPWVSKVELFPVSAIKAEGVESIVPAIVRLLQR